MRWPWSRRGAAAGLAYPVVLRGFIPPEEIERLRMDVQIAYLALDSGLQNYDESMRTAHIWGGLNFVAYRQHFPERAKSLSAVVARVQERWPAARLIYDMSSFRRIERKTYIFWHMDADGAGSHAHDPVWNFWVPLEDVGITYPSVEVIADSEAKMRRLDVRPGHLAHRSDEWVAEHFPKPRTYCPEMRRGDVFVFSHYVLHRTQPMATLAGPRIGGEFRFRIA